MIPFWPARPSRIWAGGRLFRKLVADREWAVEPKWDGFRCIVQWKPNEIECWSRHGNELALPGSVLAVLGGVDVPDGTAADGELLGPRHAGEAPSLVLFDLPILGSAFSRAPYEKRRARLVDLFGDVGGDVSATLRLPNTPSSYETALDLGCEGLVLKRKASVYPFAHSAAGPETQDWIKVKAPTQDGRIL